MVFPLLVPAGGALLDSKLSKGHSAVLFVLASLLKELEKLTNLQILGRQRHFLSCLESYRCTPLFVMGHQRSTSEGL